VPSGTGERLDRYLVLTGLASSRRAAQELIVRGMVRVNGARLHKAQVVGPTDRVEVVADLRANSIEPNPKLLIERLYVDRALIVVNKPGRMPCHPLRAGECNTVMNAMVAGFPETAVAGNTPREGGLVHRLDNGTSGALLIARTPEAFAVLRNAIRAGKIVRIYQALVAGHLASRLELNSPIAHHRTNSRKMMLGDPDTEDRKRAGRPAATLVEPVRGVGSTTLIRVVPRTGLRHQIRLHLASAGFPIVGDLLYGGPEVADLPEDRFWLHLAEIALDSPASGHIKVTAPLPRDLARLVR
jgi:23S rRNA pseudouridine1911/1915/1917 synthase